MAPPSGVGKRVKGCQIYRPFVYGSTSRPFDDKTNPKPPGVPDDHTHSWTVFVRGVDNTDITYWLRRVQFKLHESIPNPVRMIDGEPGKPFIVEETGWGEFEITLKLYYVSESGEKPQTLYHHLRLHPYGRTDEDREAMRATGEVPAWTYEEQLFNEPYEAFYEILTTGALALPKGAAAAGGAAGSGGGGGGGAAGSPAASSAAAAALAPIGKRSEGGVLARSAMVPLLSRQHSPFSKETEQLEIKKLQEAQGSVQSMTEKLLAELRVKEERLAALKKEATDAMVAG
ncbi:YEATS domain-containing protein 4 [Sporothrix schenckii 1099-18]|uniref:Protein AF-9 homolog n=1 Tax=Sporothrix schenckii 1099-18 TaxID=1397361 RepID=A0A0F2M1H2_SPOSC|nr:YEATS domain-containing protein 4 [Sporothrix schenckii 1099-18]KJR82934.1 YEATS domain-containing protein 4 [Sporothrix schenckii 1099-18]